jgi:hypothetical protein
MMPLSFNLPVRAMISSLSLGLATLTASGLPVAVDPSLGRSALQPTRRC